MAKHIHIHLGAATRDSWEESKHPRADNGQFGAGAGSEIDRRQAHHAKTTGQTLSRGLAARQAAEGRGEKRVPLRERARQAEAAKAKADAPAKKTYEQQREDAEQDPRIERVKNGRGWGYQVKYKGQTYVKNTRLEAHQFANLHNIPRGVNGRNGN